jgi:hypothetical protein
MRLYDGPRMILVHLEVQVPPDDIEPCRPRSGRASG